MDGTKYRVERMPSEENPVEPSDQGPSPPSSSAGATSTESPAHADKRPRGRPRKDATILAQATSSSSSKSRKKGRTRARVSVDEEDSLDGSEITDPIGPKDTEVQVQPPEIVEVVPPEEVDEGPPAEVLPDAFVPANTSSERLCAFCYCGARSLLGQGELRGFSVPSLHDETSVGEKTVAREIALDRREQLNGPDSLEAEPERANRFWDELSHVGLPQNLNVHSLFESGKCWAHHSCALWSEGICGSEGQSLLNVDRAIDSGSTKHCAYCKRLGASIKCCAEGCAQLYHYPCAGAAGTFQDITSLSLLCPEHLDLAIEKFVDDVNCVLCDSSGDLQDQLFCTSCGLHYHGMCLDMVVTPLRRAGWQCPECKVCQTCKNPGEDTKMLVCDMCDKGYHTFCLQPAIDSIPTNGWRCKNCRVCVQCGTRAIGQWHHTSLMCEVCAQNQDPALCCSVCASTLDPERHKDALSCHICKRWVHMECEHQNSGQAEIYSREDYVCSNCRPPAAERVTQAEDMKLGPELSPQPSPMHTDSESDPQLAPKHTDLQPFSHTPPEMHNDPPEELVPKPAQGALSEKPFIPSFTPDSHPQTTSPEQPVSPTGQRQDSVPEPQVTPHSHPQSPFIHSMGDCSIHPTTLIPLTPKIGMGKPAITKRKFSPGRPRAKQGAWSPHSSVNSPLSWSPDQHEGWDISKTRQSSGCPSWSVRVGRGSGFPGRRRPRGAGLSGRAGRGRARGRNLASPSFNPGITSIETSYPIKEEEESAMHNTVVIFSSNDSFTLKQDMCAVCGSFGLGAEGRLLACAQCGQCYHPFCVGVKMNKVVLSKGWRCLECTVCEACGQATDPGRLLLCDDCDISYHTYCLDPPLQNVPKESWKCKWCVTCTQCGATTPGLRCEWQNNYTQCAPCASLSTCPICLLDYSEGTVIVQCRQCDRWFHSSCQGLHSEEDLEKAADSCFDCTMCRTFKTTKIMTKTRDAIEPLLMTQIFTKAKEMDLSRTYTQDGVCLTESGLCQLQSLSATATRRRKPKPKLKLKIINQNSVAVLQAPVDHLSEHSRDEDMEDNRGPSVEAQGPSWGFLWSRAVTHHHCSLTEAEVLDCEAKSDSSLEREPVEDDSKGADGSKKRKRKPYRPGIGGFMVRQRSRPGQGPGKAKRTLCRKDSTGSVSETPTGNDGWTEGLPDTPVDENPPGSEVPEKIKKRYRKKKTKLEEAFPTYLQEAFFGKDLLDKSKQSRQQRTESGFLEDGQSQVERRRPPTFQSRPSNAALTTPDNSRDTEASEEPLVDLSDVLNSDADILGMLGKTSSDSGLDFCSFQVDGSPPSFVGLDIGSTSSSSPAAQQSQGGRRTPRNLSEEPLDGILSPELDKMVTDESILSKFYKIPELEGKDVEDLFTAVLSPSTSQPPPPQVPHHQATGQHSATSGLNMPHQNMGTSMFPRMPIVNGVMGPNQHFSGNATTGPCIPENLPLNRMPFSDNPRDRKFNHISRDAGHWASPPHGFGQTPPVSLSEGETEAMSNAQKSTLKWEKDEPLGELATVAPVLYTNVNFPNLKEEYPDWATRVKQIAKLWRKASSQDRAPYVQKARDNRAALRINKVQMSNETVKRHHPQQQPPEVFDPTIPLDTDLLFKDPLKPKESEHEQEWKFRQQMRQKSKQQAKIEATQKLEQVKNEQLQQQQLQQHLGCQSEDGNNSGNQSPASQPSNGSLSPMQPLCSKEGFARPQLPENPTSGPEDVFLRPPPPPPSGHLSQPQSPQVFSPGSSGSRPSSPWDPYAKMVGTPRPPPALGSNACRRLPVESVWYHRTIQIWHLTTHLCLVQHQRPTGKVKNDSDSDKEYENFLSSNSSNGMQIVKKEAHKRQAIYHLECLDPGLMRVMGSKGKVSTGLPHHQRVLFNNDGHVLRGPHPADPNFRHQELRFSFPSGAMGHQGAQEFVPRGQHPVQNMPPHMRRDTSMGDYASDPQLETRSCTDQSGLNQAQQANGNAAMGHRPLLLEEQPLLLQDLLDQERQEQQQQRQMQAMIRQRSTDSFFPNIDFDAITDPIMKAKMVALKGINKVMVQNNMGMSPMVRFPGPLPPCPESAPLPPQVIGQDGHLAQASRPNPPNFGTGFVNHAQRAQYEEWLQETQQLLQMQQKFLEEKIGAHRKSKKALSAKQRTAKKAGRDFPEEDAEQLKHVTEQQGVVQKQLEQIRKQQKEHAELIEEYRVKQQQNNMPPLMAGMHPVPGPRGMVPGGPPIGQPVMNPMMQMPTHPGQPNLPSRMPKPPLGWSPGAPIPMGAPGMTPLMPPQVPVGTSAPPHQMPMGPMPQHAQIPMDPQAAPGSAALKSMQPSSEVKFDDNNPFSEGFQERERRERLREQQERQRVQLMQESCLRSLCLHRDHLYNINSQCSPHSKELELGLHQEFSCKLIDEARWEME
uniref:[Histone H3]-lysine(4) N-trimethyltransferase n=1 Tax=Knipowitschia caucasica TaxID=637954 RepID=A0AAV2JQ26_KNICA